MSFWENNKGTFKAAGVASLKGAAIGTKKLTQAGVKAYNNRDKSRAAHGNRNRRNNRNDESDEDEEYEEDTRSHARPLNSLGNPRAYGAPPSRNGQAQPVQYAQPAQQYEQQPVQYAQQPVQYAQHQQPVQYQQQPVQYQQQPVQYQQQPVQYAQQPQPVQYQQQPQPVQYQQQQPQPVQYQQPPVQQPQQYQQSPVQYAQPVAQESFQPPQAQPQPAAQGGITLSQIRQVGAVLSNSPQGAQPAAPTKGQTPEQPVITYAQLRQFGGAAINAMGQQSQQPTAATTQQPHTVATAPAVSQSPLAYETPYQQATPPQPANGYARAPVQPPPSVSPLVQQPIPAQSQGVSYQATSPQQHQYPTSTSGNFGVPPPREESLTPKAPLADPKTFAPPPIHKARGQSTPPVSGTPPASDTAPAATAAAIKKPAPSLPSRSSAAVGEIPAAESAETAELSEPPAPPKRDWMDASQVGPPPPRPFGSKSTTAPAQPPAKPKLSVVPPSYAASQASTPSKPATTTVPHPAPPRTASSATAAESQESEPPKKNWMDVSNVGPPPPKIYRPPQADTKTAPSMPARKSAVTPAVSMAAAPDEEATPNVAESESKPEPFDITKFGPPPPRPYRAPTEEAKPSSGHHSVPNNSAEPFAHIIKKEKVVVEDGAPEKAFAESAKGKAPPPKPIKKKPALHNWSSSTEEVSSPGIKEEVKEMTQELEQVQVEENPEPVRKALVSANIGSNAAITDDNFVSSLRGNLRKTSFTRDQPNRADVEASESPFKTADKPQIAIIKPRPSLPSKPSSSASTKTLGSRNFGGVALPGLSDSNGSSIASSPAKEKENYVSGDGAISQKKKAAPPPVKAKPKALEQEPEEKPPPIIKPRPSVVPKPILGHHESRESDLKKTPPPPPAKARSHAPVEEQAPPPLAPRPRLATPPVAPPSRNAHRKQAPELDLELTSGWWAHDNLSHLPKDLEGLSYSTSFGYSSSENFRIFAFRLKDLSTLKFRFTWSRSSSDPLKSYNFDQKYLPPPQPTTQRQIITSHEKYGEYIANWCENKEGSTVGSGECWDLAHDALQKGCGKHAFISDGLNHGYLTLIIEGAPSGAQFTPSSITDSIKRGDILQFKSCVFRYAHSTVSYGAPDHTAVVLDTKGHEDFEIIHQNVNGVKKVQKGEINLSKLAEGEVKVYRAMDADWIGELVASWP